MATQPGGGGCREVQAGPRVWRAAEASRAWTQPPPASSPESCSGPCTQASEQRHRLQAGETP